jgi:hypothetical protein
LPGGDGEGPPLEAIRGRGATGSEQGGAGAVDQEGAQVGVAAFGDGAQMSVEAAGVLARDDAEEAGESASGGESREVSDEGVEGGGGDQADSGDGEVVLDEGQVVGEQLELSLAIVDFGVEVSDFRGETEQGGVKSLWERLEGVGQGGGQMRQDVARSLWDGDAELAQGAADGVQARGACGHPGATGAVERGQGVLVEGLDGDGNDLLVAMSFQKGAGRAAGFQQNRGRWPVGEKLHHLAAGQTLALTHPPWLILDRSTAMVVCFSTDSSFRELLCDSTPRWHPDAVHAVGGVHLITSADSLRSAALAAEL